MKKSTTIIFITVSFLSLTACNFSNKETATHHATSTNSRVIIKNTAEINKIKKEVSTDFSYNIGPRFRPIKKEFLDKVTSSDAFIDKEVLDKNASVKSAEVILFINEKKSHLREKGYNKKLTAGQLKLLRSFDYDTSFLVRVEYRQKNKNLNALENNYTAPYLTVVPEKQATYLLGKDVLQTYLKENSAAVRINVELEKLQAAKLFFTVTKNGTIENIRLGRTSGYPFVDIKMMELIKKTQGEWKPAENSKGEKVAQELVVSFGLMGC